MKRRTAAPAEDDLEQVAERMSADEERKRLVLVRRPRMELGEHERGDAERARRDAAPEHPDRQVAHGRDRRGQARRRGDRARRRGERPGTGRGRGGVRQS